MEAYQNAFFPEFGMNHADFDLWYKGAVACNSGEDHLAAM